MVLGVREGNLYRVKGQLMHIMSNRSRETNEEEQVAPRVVRQVAPPTTQKQREQVAPPLVKAQMESSLRIQWGGAASQNGEKDSGQGASSSGSCVDSEGVSGFKGSQETQRESGDLEGDQL